MVVAAYLLTLILTNARALHRAWLTTALSASLPNGQPPDPTEDLYRENLVLPAAAVAILTAALFAAGKLGVLDAIFGR